MMKLVLGFFVLAFVANAAYGEMKCDLGIPTIPTEWIDLKGDCLHAMRKQIQTEIDASYTYLAMGAYFSRDTVNRPGFAELFFKSAREEREHGSKLIEYLSMRGLLTHDVTNLIRVPAVDKQDWNSGAAALEDALKLETKVTKSIRNLISRCEKGLKGEHPERNEKEYNYYHLVDYLTGVYLEEQLHGQRELAGKLTTLQKMMISHGALAEFLFDKDL